MRSSPVGCLLVAMSLLVGCGGSQRAPMPDPTVGDPTLEELGFAATPSDDAALSHETDGP